MSEPLYQPRSNTAARLLGLGFFSAGAAMIYWQGVLPLLAAIREKPLVEFSIKLIILGEFFVIMGMFWIIRGLAGYTAIRVISSISPSPHRQQRQLLVMHG